MAAKLIDDKIQPACKYCAAGKELYAAGEILCRKNGIMAPQDFCRRFRYDPLKRIPNRIPKLPAYTEKDFEL